MRRAFSLADDVELDCVFDCRCVFASVYISRGMSHGVLDGDDVELDCVLDCRCVLATVCVSRGV